MGSTPTGVNTLKTQKAAMLEAFRIIVILEGLMEKIEAMIYKTVYSDQAIELDKLVNLELKEGYKLYGNPYVDPQNHRKYQALIKEESKEEKNQ